MRNIFGAIVLLLPFCPGFGQENLTLREAEARFLQNNLLLLAEEYNVEASEALALQAQLWDNPYLSAEINAFHSSENAFFDAGRNGQKAFALEQLIYLGGQKRKEVQMMRSHARQASLQLKELLRNLRFQLRVSYFSIYYDEMALAAFDRQLGQIDSLLAVYTDQAGKGNVPMKDVVRLQSLLFGLQNDRIELVNQIADERALLHLLLAAETHVVSAPSDAELQQYTQEMTLSASELQQLALESRPDLLLATEALHTAELNLQWQRSLAVPNLSLGAAYDQRGGAFDNQINLTLGMPLPLWNRNQGNIKYAEALIKQSAAGKDLYALQVKSEVLAALQKYREALQSQLAIGGEDLQQFEAVQKGVFANFQRRNITILEFTDFIESYQQSLFQYNRLRKNLVTSCEQLNYVTSTTIFN